MCALRAPSWGLRKPQRAVRTVNNDKKLPANQLCLMYVSSLKRAVVDRKTEDVISRMRSMARTKRSREPIGARGPTTEVLRRAPAVDSNLRNTSDHKTQSQWLLGSVKLVEPLNWYDPAAVLAFDPSANQEGNYGLRRSGVQRTYTRGYPPCASKHHGLRHSGRGSVRKRFPLRKSPPNPLNGTSHPRRCLKAGTHS